MKSAQPVSDFQNQQPLQGSSYSFGKLVKEYAALIENHAGEVVSDAELLPAPKETMKTHLLAAAKLAGPGDFREWLKAGYMMLSHFQVMSDAEREALSRWNTVLQVPNLDKQSGPVQKAVLSEVADCGELATQLLGRMSDEFQLLLSELRSAGL